MEKGHMVVGMDDEDRTPVPKGYGAAEWRKADEVHHAMALVADDTECVKIIYDALDAAFRSGVEEAARVAELYDETDTLSAPKAIASAIRALRVNP